MTATSRTRNAPGAEAATAPGIPEIAVYLSCIVDLPFRQAVAWKRLVEAVRCAGGGQAITDPDLRALFALPATEAARPRVYYGNEFCQHRIPGRGEFESSCRAVSELGLPLTFVTPPVNDEGCQTLVNRLSDLERCSPGSEVVVSDWGVLRLVARDFPRLEPVLGRLMLRLLRDPRITPRYRRPDAPPDALGALQRCSLTIAAYRRLLVEHGVRRVEVDNLYQGIDIDFRSLGLRPSLCIPFGYVTTGRICILGNLHLPAEQKFGTPAQPCPRPCLRVEIALSDRNARPDGGVYTFVQRGNTIFSRQTGPLVSRGLAWAAEQGARVVYQAEIPF